ncbi:hypothetical protein F4818DRAFT_402973 [Hypoxylon cercidicola]|nr:hypothetical protein F4818DRAFT_402973 [Hypoxylon cercidicola]
MERFLHTKRIHGGYVAVLLSFFRTKRKDQSPAANNAGDEANHSQNSDTATPQPEASSPVDALGTPLPDPSDTVDASASPVEIEESTQMQDNDLWREAFERISKEEKEQISEDLGQSGNENTAKSLIRIEKDQAKFNKESAKDLVRTVKDHEAKFTNEATKIKVGERVIFWRDYAARVVDGLTVLGDIGVQFAPAPSAVVWSALKVLLKAHVSEYESLVAILGCAAKALPLVKCGAVYEAVYLRDISDNSDESTANLREALVDLYAKILQLLARVKRDLKANGVELFLRALVHPGATEESIQKLDEAGKQLGLSVQACEAVQRKRENAKFQGLLESLDKPLRHIDEGVKIMLDKMSENDRTKMLDKFSNLSFGSQHERRTRYRIERTGKWLLNHQEFTEWEESSSSSILWLTGEMGVGKSILTSNVVDRYWVQNTNQSTPTAEGFAFFYYSKNDQEMKGDPIEHILGSFLRQLAIAPYDSKEIYRDLVELHRGMEEKKMTFDAVNYKQVMSRIVNHLPRTRIILDGLDEFENPPDICDIIEFLVQLVEKSERPVKVLISSRENSSITKTLLEANQNLTKIIFSHENRSDIVKFVDQTMEKIGFNWDQELKKEVKKKLCDKAHGMFRWAYLQIEQLATVDSPEEVRNQLGNLPEGLEEAYQRLYESKKGWDRKRLQRAVKWVKYAREPLSTKRLLSAIQISQGKGHGKLCLCIDERINEESLQNICRHFIVKDPSEGTWEFPHASVEEYFRGEKHKSWFSDDAQAEFAKLPLLLLTESFRVHPLPESDQDDGGAEAQSEGPLLCLRTYMTNHWVSHIKAFQGEVNESTAISRLLEEFMIAEGDRSRSGLGYKTWTRCPPIAIRWRYGIYILQDDIYLTENPAFGIVALGLHSIAKEWGDACLRQNLVQVNRAQRDLLSVAARHGHFELCSKLIEMGSDVNLILPSGSSALVEAVVRCQTACVEKLLHHGANPNIKTRVRPLCEAASTSGGLEILRLLLDHGADPDATCSRCAFKCALEAAAYRNNLDAARTLVEAGATVDSLCEEYGTPLAAAAYAGSQEVTKLLISHHADVNIYLETAGYRGVLAAAFCGWGGVRMIRYLIEEAGADTRRIISDLSGYSDWRVDYFDKWEEIGRYLYSHEYVTRGELLSLDEERRSRGLKTFFRSGFHTF